MIGYYIFFGILLFLVLILCIPIHINITYNGQFSVVVRYLFIKYTVYPMPPKKEKKKKAPEKEGEKKVEKEKKENPALKFVKEHGIDAVIELLRTLLDILGRSADISARHFVISKLVINAIIVGSDSADTAMKYAYACSTIYPMITLLQTRSRLKKHSEDISAGFLFFFFFIEFVFDSRIRPVWLGAVGIDAVFRLIAGFIRAYRMKA